MFHKLQFHEFVLERIDKFKFQNCFLVFRTLYKFIFQWIITEYTDSIASRVSLALSKLDEMAHDDITRIKKDIDLHQKDFKEAFSSYHSQLVYFLNNSMQLLQHVWDRLGDPNLYDHVINSLRSNLEMTNYQLRKFQDYVDNGYQVTLLEYPKHPTSLWVNKTMKESCIYKFDEYSSELSYIISTGSLHGLNKLINAIPGLISCVTDYKITLDQIMSSTVTNEDILRQRKQTVGVRFEKIMEVIVGEIGYIRSNSSYFNELYYQYAVMSKTKLSLTKDVGPQIIIGISNLMNSLISKVVTRAFNPLKQDIEKIKDDMQLLYHNTLDALSGLVGYFEDDRWEQSARNMNIWQGPVAELDTPYILRYVLCMNISS